MWLQRVFLPDRMPGAEFTDLNELQEIRSMLAERVVEWTEEWKRQGLEAARQQGEAALLLRLMERRFGTLEETLRQRIYAADAETLLRWAQRILTAARVEDVFQE